MERSPLPSIAHQIKDWPLEELDNVARALEQLQAHPGWSALQTLLDGEIADVDARLENGSKPLDQAEYALLHGTRRGLRSSKDAVATVIAKYRDQLARHERQPEAATTGR